MASIEELKQNTIKYLNNIFINNFENNFNINEYKYINKDNDFQLNMRYRNKNFNIIVNIFVISPPPNWDVLYNIVIKHNKKDYVYNLQIYKDNTIKFHKHIFKNKTDYIGYINNKVYIKNINNILCNYKYTDYNKYIEFFGKNYQQLIEITKKIKHNLIKIEYLFINKEKIKIKVIKFIKGDKEYLILYTNKYIKNDSYIITQRQNITYMSTLDKKQLNYNNCFNIKLKLIYIT